MTHTETTPVEETESADTRQRVIGVVSTAASIYIGAKCGMALAKRYTGWRDRRREEKSEQAIVATA